MNIGESKISYYFVDIVIVIKVPKLKKCNSYFFFSEYLFS